MSGEFLQVNRSLADLLCYHPDELLGTNLHRLGHPEDVPNSETLVEQLLNGQSAERQVERRFVTKTGGVVWALLMLSQVRCPGDPSFHLLIQLQDITRRRQCEEELHWKTAFFEAQVNSTLDGVLVVDGKGEKILQNQRLIDMFKIPRPVLDEKDHKSLLQHVTCMMKDPERFLERVLYLYAHPDETGRDQRELTDGTLLDQYSSPVAGKNGKHYGRIWIFRDITERRRIEDALRLLSSAVEQSPVSVVITDPLGRIAYVNRKFTQWTGYSFEEVLGENPRILKSGHTSPEDYQSMWRTITQGAEWRGEFRNRKKNGELYWESAAITPIKDGTGRITHFIGIMEDTTERKIMDSQLQQAQKLEAIGQLAAGITHEINTPMQYVGDNARFLQKSWPAVDQILGLCLKLRDESLAGPVAPDTIAELLQCTEETDITYLLRETPRAIGGSLEGVQRVSKIVRAMKEFSHPGSKEKCAIDINHAIETTVAVARNEWKYVADVQTCFDDTLPPVPCLAGEFNQVILNLLINAAHAIGDVVGDGSARKGSIKITTKCAGDWAEVRIQDTGAGVPREIRGRIFEPFFTTKEVGKGTGQGLALAHAVIVKKHDGQMWFDSEEGKGSTFFLRLPLKRPATGPRPSQRR